MAFTPEQRDLIKQTISFVVGFDVNKVEDKFLDFLGLTETQQHTQLKNALTNYRNAQQTERDSVGASAAASIAAYDATIAALDTFIASL